MGVTPGVTITVRKVAPFGDPLELNLRGYQLSLRKADAKLVVVEKAYCPKGHKACCAEFA